MDRQSSEKNHFSQQIPVSTSDRTALEHLADNTTLSKQKIKQMMTNGAVWLESTIGTHRLRRAKKILNTDQVLHLYYDDAIQNTNPADAILISDENEYSIWNKPRGMYSQGTKWGDHCTIYRWSEIHLKPQRPAFLVHRLDRAANGLIILAHTKKTAATLSAMFQQRKIIKRYKAVVEGLPEFPLPYSITSNIDDKPALSTIISLEKNIKNINRTTVIIEIETGRKHQIRKHLAGLGHPVIGDRLYGSKYTDEDLQLQSNYLKFNCPITDVKREYYLE